MTETLVSPLVPFQRGDFVVVSRGDNSVILWVQQPMNEPTTPGLFLGLLMSSESNFATEWDFFVSNMESGLAFDCMVQGEMYGYFMDLWVVSVVGRAEREVVSCGTYADRVPLLNGESDPRWGFKVRELHRLHSVCMGLDELMDTIEGKL